MGKEVKTARVDRLAALRDKLAKTDLRSGGGGFFSPPDGRSVVRILPEVGDMQFFYQQVGSHMLPGSDNKKQFYCPNFTSEGELDCPICDYVEELKKEGSKASLALASALRVKRKFWMNVIDRDHESVGPQIFTPGVMVFGQISSLISDPDYGDIFDIEKGIDIIIERKGKNLETEYQVKPRRDSSPLSEDEDTMNEWLDKARDLTPVEVSDDPEEDKDITKGHILFIVPYDRLKREFENADSDDDVEDEDERPVRKTTSVSTRRSAPVSKSAPVTRSLVKRKAAPDPEEEDDVEEEDDSPEEEDEVQKEMVTRTARRSLRRQ
jgi:hypothetical protein